VIGNEDKEKITVGAPKIRQPAELEGALNEKDIFEYTNITILAIIPIGYHKQNWEK